ncbi:hypothetical protein V6N11_083401 [Hibiscus sabdariffa]|uniref:Uncharacterized protein n=1 Tax=Hibiscus sabdariffa TaxID=183260 RepID=A0ABR2QLQ8_9ROSI
MRVGLSALGKDCDFFCDPAGLDVLSMGLHPQNPMDRGSEDEIRGKLSSAEITKRAEKDKDLISTKGDSEERGAINLNCVLESREIDVFCPWIERDLAGKTGYQKPIVENEIEIRNVLSKKEFQKKLQNWRGVPLQSLICKQEEITCSALTKPLEELVFLFGSVRKLCCPLSYKDFDDEKRVLQKRYWALVIGSPRRPKGTILGLFGL